MIKYIYYLIVVVDCLLLFNLPYFFTTASTFLNYLGVALLIILFLLTIKIRKSYEKFLKSQPDDADSSTNV